MLESFAIQSDSRRMKTFSAAVALSLFLAAASLAQSFQGNGNNFGSGWRSDGSGGYTGTGNNCGSGWRSDGNGGFTGTGGNFGSGWRASGGGYTGTGGNFGSGWNR